MGELWVAVDARRGPGEVTAADVVGGIPLVVRQLRAAGRHGFRGGRIRVDPGDEERTQRLLRRYPVPAGFSVEVVAGEDDPPSSAATILPLDARALYRPEDLARAAESGEPPEPELHVRSRDDARAAERRLFQRIRKSIALDGLIAYYVLRPLSRLVTHLLIDTPVSPNQATLMSLACGLGGAVSAGFGGPGGAAAAGLLYFLSGVLDCVDGDLARLRMQSSRVGEWLDSMADEINTLSLLTGIGIGLWGDGYGGVWALLAVGGTALAALTLGRLYYDLHRLGLPIDTAQYPWFFSGKSDAETPRPERGPLGKLLYGLGYLVRRDANVTVLALLLVFDLRRLAVSMLLAAVAFIALLTVVHLAIGAGRGIDRGERA